MEKIKHYSSLLVTAATPLPGMIRKPGLIKLWLFSLSAKRLYLLAGPLVLFFAVSPISQGIVDFCYPEINDKVESVILKMLQKKPKNRFQSTDTLIKALDSLKLT